MFALEGIDWRGWSAADRAAVAYLLVIRQNKDNPTVLRGLYELAGDRDALARLDNQTIHGSQTVVTDR